MAPEIRTVGRTASPGDHQQAVGERNECFKTAKLSFCEGCIEGKIYREPLKPVGEICSTEKLQLVHSDVCSPMPQNPLVERSIL